jgi:hypothetical protein
MKKNRTGSPDGEGMAKTEKSRSNGFMKFLPTPVSRILVVPFIMLVRIKRKFKMWIMIHEKSPATRGRRG